MTCAVSDRMRSRTDSRAEPYKERGKQSRGIRLSTVRNCFDRLACETDERFGSHAATPVFCAPVDSACSAR